MERLGLGPDTCLARRPTLVYGRVTGWGQNGPLANAPGHDPNYLAITGALATIGYPDRPPVLPLNLVADLSGGALYLLTGVLAALAHVRAGGEGQVVDAAMIDRRRPPLMSWVYGARSEGVWEGSRGANLMMAAARSARSTRPQTGAASPWRRSSHSFTRRYSTVSALSRRRCPHARIAHAGPSCGRRSRQHSARITRREWSDLLEGTPACVSPVLELDEVAEHPQIAARQALSGATHPSVAAPRFSRTPSAVAAGNPGSPAALLDGWGVAPRTIEALSA
jgi:alpha-methylacyl-CoA racemase